MKQSKRSIGVYHDIVLHVPYKVYYRLHFHPLFCPCHGDVLSIPIPTARLGNHSTYAVGHVTPVRDAATEGQRGLSRPCRALADNHSSTTINSTAHKSETFPAPKCTLSKSTRMRTLHATAVRVGADNETRLLFLVAVILLIENMNSLGYHLHSRLKRDKTVQRFEKSTSYSRPHYDSDNSTLD